MECYDKVINYYKNKQDKTQQGDRKMEFWDIYDKDKKPTGRTMKRNDWCLKDGEYHLTVLGVVARPDFDHKTCHDQGVGTGLLGGFRRSSTGR